MCRGAEERRDRYRICGQVVQSLCRGGEDEMSRTNCCRSGAEVNLQRCRVSEVQKMQGVQKLFRGYRGAGAGLQG